MVLPVPISPLRFQHTYPCGVRHNLMIEIAKAVAVSTHTSLRGATSAYHAPCHLKSVSTHAPLWGATTIGYGY